MIMKKTKVFQLSAYREINDRFQIWFTTETTGTFCDEMFFPLLEKIVQLYHDALQSSGKSSAEINFYIQFRLAMAMYEYEERGETK